MASIKSNNQAVFNFVKSLNPYNPEYQSRKNNRSNINQSNLEQSQYTNNYIDSEVVCCSVYNGSLMDKNSYRNQNRVTFRMSQDDNKKYINKEYKSMNTIQFTMNIHQQIRKTRDHVDQMLNIQSKHHQYRSIPKSSSMKIFKKNSQFRDTIQQPEKNFRMQLFNRKQKFPLCKASKYLIKYRHLEVKSPQNDYKYEQSKHKDVETYEKKSGKSVASWSGNTSIITKEQKKINSKYKNHNNKIYENNNHQHHMIGISQQKLNLQMEIFKNRLNQMLNSQ